MYKIIVLQDLCIFFFQSNPKKQTNKRICVPFTCAAVLLPSGQQKLSAVWLHTHEWGSSDACQLLAIQYRMCSSRSSAVTSPVDPLCPTYLSGNNSFHKLFARGQSFTVLRLQLYYVHSPSPADSSAGPQYWCTKFVTFQTDVLNMMFYNWPTWRH